MTCSTTPATPSTPGSHRNDGCKTTDVALGPDTPSGPRPRRDQPAPQLRVPDPTTTEETTEEEPMRRFDPSVRERGATTTEYAIVMFFIGIVLMVAVGFFGDSVDGLFGYIVEGLPF